MDALPIRKLLDELEILDKPKLLNPSDSEKTNPKGYAVVLYGDYNTPAELVAEAIKNVIPMDENSAYEIMLQAHRNNFAHVKTYGSYDIADTKARKLQEYCRNSRDYDWAKEAQNMSLDTPFPTRFDVEEI